MPTQQYLWLAACAIAALRLHQNHSNNDLPDSQQSPLTDVTGVAGRLRHHDSPPANDPTAALLVLIPVLLQFYAIYSANLTISAPVFCKITRRRFFAASALNALPIQACVVLILLAHLCQKDHLPTVGVLDDPRRCHL